jgi:hypothetical protein
MATFSVDSNIRKKIFNIPSITPVTQSSVMISGPSLTNASISSMSNIISSKPKLITRADLLNLGKDIKLVGYDPLADLITNSNKPFSPKLLNYIEPYEIKGSIKTLFYTEVNSGLKVGERVFIINGNYDSDSLIELNKYKKGRDGYKILFIDNCKVVLDIDYTGVLPYNSTSDDDFIKIYYIRNESEFMHANRAITTRSGSFDNKFHFYQNNIAFIDSDYDPMGGWGANQGVSTTPGFFVRRNVIQPGWLNITTDFINSGSYSYALSPTYFNVDRIKIMNADFTYNGKEFKEGYIYKWNVGPTQSEWITDVSYFKPYLGKGNFRDGNFRGQWNSGIYGQYSKRIKWDGDKSVWNIGTLINTTWKKGKMNSLYTASQSYFSSFDNYGLPYQKANSPNNAGRGYNFVINSSIETSEISNGSFYTTKFGTQSSATYSIVENEILGYDTTYTNNIKNAFFNDCEFNNSYLENTELKNTKSNNSRFEKVKSINSYFNNSVLKNSNYNSDNIVKVYAYDEFMASEHRSALTIYSSTFNPDQKVYKFYINKEGYDRLRTGDAFYIKGLKINDNSKNVINFFDKKFKIGSWTEYTEEKFTVTINGKRGYEYSAFLSTPLDNSYKFTSVYTSTSPSYYTKSYDSNPNSKYYSIDIWVSRFDIDQFLTSENINFNRGATASDEAYVIDPISLGNVIDISGAYIVDSDFESGLIENSDWNSGSHIETNNDNNITIPSLSGGLYNLSIDSNGYIVATTSYNPLYGESKLASVGDVLFLDSVDFNYGTISRIPDSYKVISNTNGVYTLKELGTASQIIGLSASSGYYHTNLAENRYGHLKKLKIDKSNIKSGFFRRSYLNGSLIQNIDYNAFDKDYDNLEKIKSLVVSDSIFSDNENILSTATYLNSFFIPGTDFWNSGIIQNSIWVGGTFSNGVIRDSRWLDGVFENGWFYNSRTFNGTASAISPFYYSENINSYYKAGDLLPNNRNSWQSGKFIDGDFYKSDWESGTFSGGRFQYSKFYDGVIENGTIGSNQISTDDTRVYNGTVSYTTVNNASIYSIDTSFGKTYSQNINWINGIFNNGVFGSDILQNAEHSSTWNNGIFNGGQFTTNGKWLNGTFNGGKFISGYGWTQSDSTSQSDYGWESGKFNGGEFGNANGLTNSTWYTGEFNGGIFKGRVWNNGIFLYGEFQGSGGNPVAGLTCANAGLFTDSYTYSYWGKWRDGIFTNTKDKFIKNEKFFTTPILHTSLEKNNRVTRSGKFKNALWLSGTFSHPNGEMFSSVWLDGAFERGKFNYSSFNPYVERSQLGITSSTLTSELLYNGEFDNDGNLFSVGLQDMGWATSSTASGVNYATFSAGYTASFLPGSYMAHYEGDALTSGLYLYNKYTNLASGHYQIDLDVVQCSSNIHLMLNLGTSSVYDSYSPSLGINSFRCRTNGGSVSLYVDSNSLGGSISIDSLSIKRILPTFNFNHDNCYWENGELNESEFYISNWDNGKFIMGTGIGMVWRNGISNYMNAFNIFWENGLWRNGNWYGSSFEFNGLITEDYKYQILQRGMSWSGTSSAHIWNIFLETEQEKPVISATAYAPIGRTGVDYSSGIPEEYRDDTPMLLE